MADEALIAWTYIEPKIPALSLCEGLHRAEGKLLSPNKGQVYSDMGGLGFVSVDVPLEGGFEGVKRSLKTALKEFNVKARSFAGGVEIFECERGW